MSVLTICVRHMYFYYKKFKFQLIFMEGYFWNIMECKLFCWVRQKIEERLITNMAYPLCIIYGFEPSVLSIDNVTSHYLCLLRRVLSVRRYRKNISIKYDDKVGTRQLVVCKISVSRYAVSSSACNFSCVVHVYECVVPCAFVLVRSIVWCNCT